jgi:putative N-acetyltransferase (TIGR04045 family)
MSSTCEMEELSIVAAPPRIRRSDASVRVKLATGALEVGSTRALRRAVFFEEQQIFQGDDIDAIDAVALPIAAILSMPGAADEVVGTVRIHQPEPGLWYGSRLAVAKHARRIGSVGSGLIKLAVSTANARGCHPFLAQVQAQNVPLFERLHWCSLEEMDIHGRPHHLMQADLAHYPAIHDGETGFVLNRQTS